MSLSTNDAELIARAIESRLGDVYTAEIGRVEKYYPATQTADVAPTVRRAVPTGPESDPKLEDLPVVPNVPVLFPRGGAFTVSWPINKGDHVVLLVMSRAFGQWRKTGKTSDPGDLRQHHLGNAVALPMLAPNAGVMPEAQAGANAFTIAGPLIVLGAADATDFAALASKCDSNFTMIKSAISGATPTSGDGGAALKSAIVGALNFEPVACEKVKIK